MTAAKHWQTDGGETVGLPGSTRKSSQWAGWGQEASLRGIPHEAAWAYRSQPSPLTLIRAARNCIFTNPPSRHWLHRTLRAEGGDGGRGAPEPMGQATRSVFRKSALFLGTSPKQPSNSTPTSEYQLAHTNSVSSRRDRDKFSDPAPGCSLRAAAS